MSWSSTVMRPKSIATVVVVLSGTAAVSSTPTDRAVMSCSVVSGGISDTDPTKVVLPAPNPPATRTLSGMSCWPACVGAPRDSTRTESIQKPPKDRVAGPAVGGDRLRQVDGEVAGVGEVADQHPGDPHGHLQRRADLRQRHRPGAHPDDGAQLHLQRRARSAGALGGGHHRLQRQVLPGGPGAAAGERVHRHDAVFAAVVAHGAAPPELTRGAGVRTYPTRVASR